MKIYTKAGDHGFTSNYLGGKVSKGEVLMELQGSIDEVNANVGLLRSKINKISDKKDEIDYIDEVLKKIQYNLYEVGSEIAKDFREIIIYEDDIKLLEVNIDSMVKKMPQLKNFLYYSGTEEATTAQVIRAIVRRAERVFARLLQNSEENLYPLSYQYINRLSDYFYTLARYINFLSNVSEDIMM